MSQLLVGCPLCCQSTFSSTNALCIALITVASKSLKCPLCEDVLCGLDKLTIHLLSHLLVQPTDQLANQINTETNHSLTKQKLQETERDEITVTNLKLVDEQHKCFETITNKFDNIEKPFDYSTDDENIMRPFLDNRQTQKIIVDDEVMLVFDKSKIQDGIPECSSKKIIFTSVNTETHLKNIVDDSHQNMHGLPSLNNLQSVKDNYDSDIYFKTDHIAQSSVDIVVSELNNNDLSEYSIKNGKSQIKDGIVFKETDGINGLDQITFGNQVDVIDYSFKMSDNLAESVLSVDKTKINLCSFETEPSNHNDKSGYHNGLCSGLVNDPNLGSNSSSLVGLECGECPVTFSDLKMLSMHQELVHSNQNCEEKKKVYSCKLCTKSFKMKGSLIVHTKVAHSAGPTALSKLLEATKKNEPLCVNYDVIPFSCSVCGKGFKKEQHLFQHEKIHEGKQWECDVCGKTFTTKYFLKKHHLLHTGETPYTCATCNKSFTFQQSYHKHLLYHSDDKPYQCTECGRSFKELSTLHNHQRIHTGEKPYSCETCGKCFRQRVSYLVHRRIHTGDMPYKCSECNKSFRYKVSERTHKCSGNVGLTNDDSNEFLLVSSQKALESRKAAEENDLPVFSSQDNNSTCELPGPAHDWLQQSYSSSNKDRSTLVDNNYVESTDFFSLNMSSTCQYTSDKLQNLRLSPDNSMKWEGEKNEPMKNDDKLGTNLHSGLIETVSHEYLKELLYNVTDYH